MFSTSTIQELWTSDAIERLFGGSGIGFVIVSHDRRLVDANDTFCEMVGYSREELSTMSITDLTHPEDQGMTQKLFKSSLQPNLVQTFEKRYITKSGQALWVKGRSEPLREPDLPEGYRIVMLENITQRKENELVLEQMAAIVDKSDDAIFRSDRTGIIEFWSKGAERLYGYTAAEAIGRHASFIVANDYTPQEQDVLERMHRGEAVKQPNGLCVDKHGRHIEVSVLIFPLKDKQGEIMAFAAVHRDVSEIRQLGEQLRLSQRMETAGMLAGGIAHDFNNILTVIKGSCDVLALEAPELYRQSRHLDLIERSADKAAALTRQLLAFSRRQKISPETLDPRLMVEKLLPMMQRTFGEDITLATDLRSSWLIKEDPTQLEQIILNISVNARSAMPKGGRITIETSNFVTTDGVLSVMPGWSSHVPEPVKPGEYVRLSVADAGVGMKREVLERIFEPFFTTKDKGEGTGLGLAVVYGMVTQVGGAINVMSKPGEGTVFQIFLPRVSEAATASSPQEGRMKPGDRKGSVLVVDDDADVRSLIVRVLEFAGYDVRQADCAEAVLNNHALADVDLIVSDVVMPGLSGPEFSEVWLKEHPDARFMFISGFVEDDKYTRILRAGNFLSKPFKPAVFLSKVESLINK